MPENTAARTIRLREVGRMPAVEAQELNVGDTLMWNGGETTTVTALVKESPQFLRITEKNTRTGQEWDRRMKKTRLVARIGRGIAPGEKTAQGNAEKRPRTIDIEGIGWTCVEAGRKWTAEYDGVQFELERRTANVLDQCPDTGWYLYGGGHFGTYMAARFKAAAVEAFPYICPKDGHLPASEAEALAKRHPVDSAAVYAPEGTTARDVVIVKSGPDKDGTVEVLSMKQGGKAVRVPLTALEELPELPPAPEGDPTDYWTVTDDKGQEVTLVRAETMESARAEVEKDPQTAAVSKRLGGLFYRRVRTSELPPAIRAAVEADAAGRVGWWAVKDREGNLITQVEATSYDHAVRVADQDPKVRAARPGSGGLVFMRLASISKAATHPLGCLPESADVPQVKAAVRLLIHDGQPLAAFDERGRCISAGAYLDPRRETGEVVLELLAEHRPPAGWDELDAERVRVTHEYADLFRVAGWTVQEFQEPDHTGRERLARLILTPPAPTAR